MSWSNINRRDAEHPWGPKPFDERELSEQKGSSSGSEKGLFFKIEPGIKKAVETDGYRDWPVQGEAISGEEWRVELEKKMRLAEKKGYEEGFQRGKTEGYEAGKRELSGLSSDLLNAISQLAGQKEALLREAQAELTDLALAIAKKIVGKELALNKEAVISIVEAAIKAAIDREHLTIKINPSFLNEITSYKPHLLSFVDGIKNVIIEEDLSLGPGDCVVETLYGTVDARIDSQFEQMREVVKKAPVEGDSAMEDKGELSDPLQNLARPD